MARILIIDDDAQIRRMLKQMLDGAGYDAVDAADGKQGIALFREHPFDLVITDLIMPEKEGIEMIMELKAEYPGVKIIAMSGGARMGPDAYLKLADSLGAERTFAKPIGRHTLMTAIQELLESDDTELP